MDFQNVKTEVLEGIATVTITREKALNALDARTLDELEATFDAGDAEKKGIKGFLLTGAGEKAFVAGADINALADVRETAVGVKAAERGQAVFRKIERSARPVIACVNGFAFGGGLELALACHFRYATKNAKVGLPEVKLGLIPGYGGTQRLPREIGRGRALELILTGEAVDADEALRLGIVNRVFATKPDMLEGAKKTLQTIASRGPLAVATAIAAVDAGLDVGIDAGMAVEAQAFARVICSEDGREGARAFLEKRNAVFKGR